MLKKIDTFFDEYYQNQYYFSYYVEAQYLC